MAVISRMQKIQVPGASPKRMFKAMVTESHTLFPKIMPETIKSIDLLSGRDGPGTTRQTNLTDNSYVKHEIVSFDADKCTLIYSLIEGAWLGNKLEKVNYEVKFGGSDSDGRVVELISAYIPKDGVVFNEEEIKASETQAKEFYTAVEKYLHENPSVYA